MIADNLSAHMTEEVERWVRRHARFRLHFTPTHASWLNAFEGWFSKLEAKAMKRRSFASVPALQKAAREYAEAGNQRARPFVWTKSSDEILRKVRRIQQLSVTDH